MKKEIRNNPFNPLACLTNPTVFADGRVFIPTGRPHFHGSAASRANPSKEGPFKFPSYAQIFVGKYSSILSRGPKNPITTDEVMKVVKNAREIQAGIIKQGASFIDQFGLWEGDEEPSVQVLIFFELGKEKTYEDFQSNIFDLCNLLINEFGQFTILTNFYKEGQPDVGYKFKHD